MAPFDYHRNTDERFMLWEEMAHSLFETESTGEPVTVILEAHDLELGAYVLARTDMTDELKGALKQLDAKTFTYGDCLQDPDLASAALRLLNVIGEVDNARTL